MFKTLFFKNGFFHIIEFLKNASENKIAAALDRMRLLKCIKINNKVQNLQKLLMFKRHTTIFCFVCLFLLVLFLLQYSISVHLLFAKFLDCCQLTIISGLFGRLLRVFDCIDGTRTRCCNKISINTNIYTQNFFFFSNQTRYGFF